MKLTARCLTEHPTNERYRHELAFGAAGGSSYTRYSAAPPREVTADAACTLKQLGGWVILDVDLSKVAGLGLGGQRGSRAALFHTHLPPGTQAGESVRIHLSGMDASLSLKFAEAAHPQFERSGDDLLMTHWLPAWHNRDWWRRRVYVRSICGPRRVLCADGDTVVDGEVRSLPGLGMPFKASAGQYRSP